MTLFPVLVDVYHKEQLVTREEAVKVASDEWEWIWKWENIVVTKDGVTAARMADILDKYGFNDVAQRIGVLVDVYHKEQLVTIEDAEKAASDQRKWAEVAVTKDGDTAVKIADIMDKYDFNYVGHRIRILVDVYHKEQLVTREEAVKIASDEWEWIGKWENIVVTKDGVTAARMADILDKYGFNDVAQRIGGPPPPTQSKIRSVVASRVQRSSRYAMSDTSVFGTSIRKTSLDINRSEPEPRRKVTSECDTKSMKESYVGKLNVIEEGRSNFWTRTLKTFVSLFHGMSHEAVLSRMCWLPFGYDSITVDRRGGTYHLCSDGLTKLTAPRNAVRDETAEIRYAIIAMGPFQLPPNYQLGSFVVYVHYNPEEITSPVTLSLPTWYGGDVVPGEPPPDGLSFVVAPHTLGLWDTQYSFQLDNGGKFASTSAALSIEGHSSLFAAVFEEGATCTYFATKLEYEPSSDGWVNTLTVCIVLSYASDLWTEIIKKYWGSSNVTVEHLTTFQFKENGRLEAHISEDSASMVALNGPRQMAKEGITFEYHNIRNATILEKAVTGKRYPPKMMFNICSLRPEVSPSPVVSKQVHFGINGANVEICSNKNVYISQTVNQDPSSPNPPTPSLHNKKPSDAVLNGIVRISPDWTSWILELGVPIEEVRVFRLDQVMGGVFALQYWRDGKSGELYPTTWKFLLDTVEEAKGPEVAQKILIKAEQNEALWCMS